MALEQPLSEPCAALRARQPGRGIDRRSVHAGLESVSLFAAASKNNALKLCRVNPNRGHGCSADAAEFQIPESAPDRLRIRAHAERFRAIH